MAPTAPPMGMMPWKTPCATEMSKSIRYYLVMMLKSTAER
jgi:hypothetical protein